MKANHPKGWDAKPQASELERRVYKMTGRKTPLRVISIFLAFIVWGLFFPSVTNGSVNVETADLGDVAVGSTSVIPLQITNTGSSTLILYFNYEHYSCNFSLPPQELLLQPGGTVNVEISWTPAEGSEGTTCSDTLKVFNGRDLLETVLVTGRAVEAGGPKGDPNGTIVIGERDTGVMDRLHEGRLISERIEECAAEAKNHGQFVRCVSALANELKKAEIISGKDRWALQICAALEKFPHRPRSKLRWHRLDKGRAHQCLRRSYR